MRAIGCNRLDDSLLVLQIFSLLLSSHSLSVAQELWAARNSATMQDVTSYQKVSRLIHINSYFSKMLSE